MLLTAVAVMATDYTDKLSITNNISGNVPEDIAINKTLDAQTISVEEGTDGVYTFTLDLRSDPDVSEILVFSAPVTENADGTISSLARRWLRRSLRRNGPHTAHTSQLTARFMTASFTHTSSLTGAASLPTIPTKAMTTPSSSAPTLTARLPSAR